MGKKKNKGAVENGPISQMPAVIDEHNDVKAVDHGATATTAVENEPLVAVEQQIVYLAQQVQDTSGALIELAGYQASDSARLESIEAKLDDILRNQQQLFTAFAAQSERHQQAIDAEASRSYASCILASLASAWWFYQRQHDWQVAARVRAEEELATVRRQQPQGRPKVLHSIHLCHNIPALHHHSCSAHRLLRQQCQFGCSRQNLKV